MYQTKLRASLGLYTFNNFSRSKWIILIGHFIHSVFFQIFCRLQSSKLVVCSFEVMRSVSATKDDVKNRWKATVLPKQTIGTWKYSIARFHASGKVGRRRFHSFFLSFFSSRKHTKMPRLREVLSEIADVAYMHSPFFCNK